LSGGADDDAMLDCHARDRLAETLDAYPAQVWLMQRCLFWQHMALNVRWASPLVDIVGASEDIDFSELAWHIDPPANWPSRPLPTDRSFRSGLIGTSREFDYSTLAFMRRHRTAGTVVRRRGAPHHMVGLRVVDDGLEVTATVDGLQVESLRELARIRMDSVMAETIALAAIGRPVSSLVDHPWLTETHWPVVSAQVFDFHSIVTFHTGRAAWRMPWPVVI